MSFGGPEGFLSAGTLARRSAFPRTPLNVNWVKHPIYFWAVHIFGGVLTGVAAFFTQSVDPQVQLPDQSVGELFTALACLLNDDARGD